MPQHMTRAEDELRHHPRLTHHLHYDQAAFYIADYECDVILQDWRGQAHRLIVRTGNQRVATAGPYTPWGILGR